MKIIVDTNIVFSGILNSSSNIARILIQSKGNFDFYSSSFLRQELRKHYPKIAKFTHLSHNDIDELETLVTKKIKFIHESLIPKTHFISAEKLVADIDFDDVPFVALTKHLKGKLWTGDKKLITGLLKRGFTDVATTAQLLKIEKERT